jgi:hypothetical protein
VGKLVLGGIVISSKWPTGDFTPDQFHLPVKHRITMDVASIIKDAMPESKGHNVRVLSQNGANVGPGSGGLHRDANFLSKNFPRGRPKLYITAEDDDFDELTVQEWRDEGFDVEYFSVNSYQSKDGGYIRKLKDLSLEEIGPCEKFGIIGMSSGSNCEHC